MSISVPKSTLPMLKTHRKHSQILPSRARAQIIFMRFYLNTIVFHKKKCSGRRPIIRVSCDTAFINCNPKVNPYQRNFSVLRINGKKMYFNPCFNPWLKWSSLWCGDNSLLFTFELSLWIIGGLFCLKNWYSKFRYRKQNKQLGYYSYYNNIFTKTIFFSKIMLLQIK